ncbi:putative Ig domain-containing protein [Streptomyces decoyicus]|uniref:putative Ig domain-containing protein n=1 Tax=Streptomyces decoyicus TaxID=249567 RepID=UPI003629220D
MHIRHIALYALAAGALVVPVMLFGEGEGADAATGTGAESVADTAQTVVVQPDPVAPGAGFSVSDGGSCPGDTAEATFDDAAIPAMQLSAQSGEISGTAIVPEGTAPGSYRVTLTCGATSGARQSALDPGRAGDEEHGGARGTADGDGDGHGRAQERGEESGDGRKTLTGTMIVSGGADEVVPQGGADTGAGGAAGTGRTATTLTGVLLLAAVGWGALRRRRPSDPRS